jgi:hypothetical protein
MIQKLWIRLDPTLLDEKDGNSEAGASPLRFLSELHSARSLPRRIRNK